MARKATTSSHTIRAVVRDAEVSACDFAGPYADDKARRRHGQHDAGRKAHDQEPADQPREQRARRARP